MIRFGSVCSGIEAASCAWEPLGWRAAFFSEIAKFPSAVLAHHYPTVPNYGDLNAFASWPDAELDLLVGGTPCQSFSVAGLRGGLADPRGNLALVYLALANRYRPRWIVWENVPGVLSSNKGRDFGAFLGALGELGYGWAYRVLDAFRFGSPIRRRRVFVVGSRRGWREAVGVLFQPESLRGNSPQVLTGESEVGSPPFLTRVGAMAFDEGTPCILETYGPRRCTPREWERALGFPDGYTNIPQASPCRSDNPESAEPRAKVWNNGGSVPGDDDQARPSLRSVRLPDGVSRRSRIAADGPRYQALGNSMAVPVIRWIGERIQKVEATL